MATRDTSSAPGGIVPGGTYRHLLTGLAAIILVAPLTGGRLWSARLDDYLIVFMLLAALYDITRSRHSVAIAVVLGLPAIVGRLVAAQLPDPPVVVAVLVFASSAIFLAFLVVQILDDVLRGRRLTGERIIGAVCAYLVIGFLWALLFLFLEVVQPGSVAVPPQLLERGGGLSPFIYFSFVTLTTLGYGDIQPVSLLARNFAWIEAVVGQLYLAIMIAWLVGLHVARGREGAAG